jgi:hypothetical protein
MDDTNAPAPRSDSETLSPVEQVQALVGDVKALAEAELAYAKSRLAYSGGVILAGAAFPVRRGCCTDPWLASDPDSLCGALAGYGYCRSVIPPRRMGGRKLRAIDSQ